MLQYMRIYEENSKKKVNNKCSFTENKNYKAVRQSNELKFKHKIIRVLLKFIIF